MDPLTESGRRRSFLKQILRAAALAFGAGALGFAFWDRQGPDPRTLRTTTPPLPTYNQPQLSGRLVVVHGEKIGRAHV